MPLRRLLIRHNWQSNNSAGRGCAFTGERWGKYLPGCFQVSRETTSPLHPPLEVRDAVVIYTVYLYIFICYGSCHSQQPLPSHPSLSWHHHAHSLHTQLWLILLRTPGRHQSSSSECSFPPPGPAPLCSDWNSPSFLHPFLCYPFSFSSALGALESETVGFLVNVIVDA